ncbi:MAG TPA: carboxypeptidase-like regulatory domain-containing protein, partial [Vicinamibacterales bacterium]|nr:carboxypeptidase-like regulatory domain-containing protein [Vicinamibacterales bacterium]
MHRLLLFLVYLVLVTVSAPPASAQGTTSPITGTVRDSSGGALPGATVSARSLETGAVRTVVSDEAGRFVVTGVPVGAYELRVELAGFRPAQSRVDLVVGSQAVVPVVLHVGGVTEAVSVSGAAPVNVTSSELSYLVSREAIEQLPLNGRNYTDLAMLQPGVHAYPHRDGGSVVAHGLAMSVNGQDPRSNVYLIDG